MPPDYALTLALICFAGGAIYTTLPFLDTFLSFPDTLLPVLDTPITFLDTPIHFQSTLSRPGKDTQPLAALTSLS